MKFKIEENTRPIQTQYYVLYKKNFLSRWRYTKNKLGLTAYWVTKKGAEVYIHQEKIRLGLIK